MKTNYSNDKLNFVLQAVPDPTEIVNPNGENAGPLERIISIPIYEDDSYASIVYRFLREFGDMDVVDVMHGLPRRVRQREEQWEKINQKSQ